MSGPIQSIRSGDWLTPSRMRGYSLLLIAFYAVTVIAWIALSNGLVARDGKPIGTDFSNVYAAGVLTWEGRPGDAYDPALQHAAEKKVFGEETPFYGWHYPPFFLIAAAALALLPYGLALLAWMALTLPAYLAAIRAIAPQPQALLLAAAFPAVFVNLGHGQNGFLTAALLGGALVLLDKRPLLAGVLIGCLAYKPQFGVMIPLVLLATARWRVIASAGATIIALAAASTMLFGVSIWTAFKNSAGFSREIVLEAGGTGWEKIQTLFSAVRMWDGSVELAYAAQALLALLLAASLVWLWRSRAAFDLKAAALALACLLATPYMLDYDMVALAVAIAFAAQHGLANGFRPYEISVLALAWIAPLAARPIAHAIGLPVGLLVLLALYGMIVNRAMTEAGSSAALRPVRAA